MSNNEFLKLIKNQRNSKKTKKFEGTLLEYLSNLRMQIQKLLN